MHAALYSDRQLHFVHERLRIAIWIGLVCNPTFIFIDAVLTPNEYHSLLGMRAAVEVGLLALLLLRRTRMGLRHPYVLLVLFYCDLCFGLAHFSRITGGFSSLHYNGFGLVFLGTAAFIPSNWRVHALGQSLSLAYYFGINLLSPLVEIDFTSALHNFFVLFWVCVICDYSVYLYERLLLSEFTVRRQLEESNTKLREMDRLKSEFFANISHELRTPLTLILGGLRTLQKDSDEAKRQVIEAGRRNAARLLRLINDLLELAKADSGRMTLSKQSVDLCALVKRIAANFESSDSRRVHLSGAHRTLPAEVDPEKISKVLYNLISNAFKFSDPQRGEVWIAVKEDAASVRISVEDNGIGIPQDQLQRIFDRFTQVEGSTSRRYEGTGIGLALVKELVSLHGGEVSVDSVLGRGSTFTITLPTGRPNADDLRPLEEEEAVPAPDESPSRLEPVPDAPAGSETGPDRPVLVVADDNQDLRAYLQQVLAPDYTIALARNGAEALTLIKGLRPELVLTDIMMPEMSGYDLLKALREDETLRGIPVVLLTARAGAEARVESLDAGADDYISKPFDEHELLARVRNLIRSRRQERRLAELERSKLYKFLPPRLGDIILSTEAERFLNGHRAEITVVFVDLRGFTSFSELADPEDVMRILHEYHAAIGPLISRWEGTLERFSGDALMIFFNDPVPLSDHPERALRMAVEMRRRLQALAREWSEQEIHLGCGIGIDVGHATLGAVGFESRQDYAAIGPVTNLAARLCSHALNEQILVSKRFFQRVHALVDVESVGTLSVKGFSRPVEAYNIVKLKGAEEPRPA